MKYHVVLLMVLNVIFGMFMACLNLHANLLRRNSWLKEQFPLVVAHRGYSGRYPENTPIAFQKSIGCADMIEFDIQLSKENQLVVMHDMTLTRTTDGTGCVQDCTFEEIKQLDAGSWFDCRFHKQRVPTLDEVLALAKDKINLDIEVKEPQKNIKDLSAFACRIIDALRRYEMRKNVLVSSFFHPILDHIKALDPQIKILFLFHTTLNDFKKKPLQDLISLLQKHRAYGAGFDHMEMSRHLIQRLHEAHFFVAVYTVNRFRDFARCLRFGADAVITDYPNRFYSVKRQKNYLGNAAVTQRSFPSRS